jgi:hypothetical protein
MSPTIFRKEKYRYFFNSREETRMHVHIATPDGVAKFWLEPIISLADFHNLSTKDLKEILETVEERQHEFIASWKKHFSQ